MKRRIRSWALVALLLAAAPPLAALQDDPDEPPEIVLASGVGRLIGPGPGEVPLAWIETARGLRVSIQPLLARLGGRLEPKTLRASYALSVGGVEFVVAPGSPAVTHEVEISSLSLPPLEREGTLFVPVDLVERTWGAVAGVTSSWDPATRRLFVDRPVARELPVELSLVHVQGVTTIVLRLTDPVRYRVEKQEDTVEIVPIVDRFVPAPVRASGEDPFVRSVTVSADRVRIELAADVEIDDYALSGPFRIVLDLFQAREAPVAALVEPPVRPTRSRGVRTVVLDPGHGGAETGAIGPAGTMEKDLNLAIARTLAQKLRSRLGLEVVLTRNDDVTMDLDDRSALANQRKADLFLSIHLNSTSRGRARGAETYFLSLAASDDRAAELAAVENLAGGDPAAPGSDEFDLQLLLWDLAQSRHLAASQRFATIVQEELNRQLELPDRGVKQAPFRVLTGAAMPAVLVELGFLSNRDEEKILRDPEYRTELAETLVRAIGRFKAESEPGGAADAGSEPGGAADPEAEP